MVMDNDRALREACADLTLELGWDGVTFSGVAKRAGLTVGAVYGRADSTADLGADVWEADAGPWLCSVVEELLAQGRTSDPASVAAGFAVWEANPRMSAVVTELLIASLFDVDLAEVVLADAREILGRRCTPSATVTAHQAAASTLFLSFAFGRALAARGGGTLPSIDFNQLRALAGYFGAEPRVDMPAQPPRLEWRRDLDVLDPHFASLLSGTLDVIGRVGYKRATISKIARTSKVPRGSVLNHFDSKVALVAEAAHRCLVTPMGVWLQYEPVVGKHGALVSRALFLRDFLAADNAANWAVNLELARTAQFEPALAEFQVSGNVLEHTHLGVMLVAAVVPGLEGLPFIGPFMAGTAT